MNKEGKGDMEKCIKGCERKEGSSMQRDGERGKE